MSPISKSEHVLLFAKELQKILFLIAFTDKKQYKKCKQDPSEVRPSTSSFQQTSSSATSTTSTMKLLIVVTLFAAASANVFQNPWPFAVVSRDVKIDTDKPVAILRSVNNLKEDGSWNHGFASEDGIQVEASGFQKRLGPEPEDIGAVSRGSYSYTSPEGVVLTITWTADENGFQAKGDHLPVAPPMPKHVVKMLADLRAAGRL